MDDERGRWLYFGCFLSSGFIAQRRTLVPHWFKLIFLKLNRMVDSILLQRLKVLHLDSQNFSVDVFSCFINLHNLLLSSYSLR